MNPELLLAHEAFLRAIVRGLVDDASTADDVVQETFSVALSRPPNVVRSVRGFLARCARSVVIDRRRAEARRARREVAAAARESVPSAAEIAEREQARRLVVDAVLALDEPYRTAILLRFDRGLPPREIARMLDVPVETARTRVKRALERLRERLDRAFHGDRGSWCAVLLPLAARPEGLLVSNLGAAIGGAVIMKWWISTVAALVLACGAFFLLRGESDASSATRGGATHALADSAPGALERGAAETGTRREDIAPTPTDAAGSPVAPSAARELAGVVVDLAGAPIAGANVAAWSDRRIDSPTPDALPPLATGVAVVAGIARTTTGGDGAFRLDVADVSAPFGVLAVADGFAPITEHGVGVGETLRLVLEPPRALAGRVLDVRGHPIDGAEVRWSGLVGGALIERRARSDASGAYRLDQLPAVSARIVSGRAACGWIEATKDGFAPLLVEPTPLTSTNSTARMDLVLSAGISLDVHVIDAESRAPIAGAVVELRSDEGAVEHVDGEPWRTSPLEGRSLGAATSDAAGFARFEHVPSLGFHEGTFSMYTERGAIIAHVVANRSGYAEGKVDVLALDDGARQTLEVALAASATIEGRVVDASGHGIAGAIVTDEPGILRYDGLFDRSVRLPRTDAEGRYSLLVPMATAAPRGAAVEIEIGARRELGTEVNTVRVTPRAEAVTTAPDITLGRAAAVIIAVVDPAGRGVAGALVSREDRFAPQRTDADGRVQVELGAKTSGKVTVRARGFAPATSLVDAPASQTPPVVTIRLEPAHALHGIVRFEDGTPVAGAEVDLLPIGESPAALFRTAIDSGSGDRAVERFARIRARADGRFTLRDLPAGPFVLGARATGIATSDHRRGPLIVFVESAVPDGPETALMLPGVPSAGDGVVLVGRVRDAITGDAVCRVAATLSGERGTFEGEMFAPGEFRVKDAPAGDYALAVRCLGWMPATIDRVKIAEATPAVPPVVEIALSRGATVHGSVRTRDGSPLGEALVNFSPENGGAPVWGRVDADGDYEVSGLAPGRYRPAVQFSIRYPGVRAFVIEGEARVDVAPGAREISFDVRLEPAGTLRIQVTSAALPPEEQDGAVATAEQARAAGRSFIEVRSKDGALIQRFANPTSGGWHWLDVKPGDYSITASIDGAEPERRTVTVAEGEGFEVRFGN